MEPSNNQNEPQESQNKPSENSKKPFVYWDVVEKVETIFSIFGNFVTISSISGLTVIAAFSPKLNSPKVPDVQPLKSQLIKVQSEEYNPTESEKLQEQLAATFKKTKEYYSLIKQELNQNKQMLSVEEGNLTSNQEQQLAKNCIEERLDTQITDLQEMERRFQAGLEAKVFLDSDDKLKALARESGDVALVDYPVDSHKEIQVFYGNIDDFLFTLHHCLVMGKPDLLNEVLDEERITLAPQIPAAYIKALQFLRDQRVPDAMSSEAATEINLYFDYLIDRLSRIA